MPYVDYAEVRKRASIADVLSRYNVNLKRVNTDSLRGKCCLPTHSNQKENNSFCVSTLKNCWSCKSDSCKAASGREGGNIADLVMLMESLPTAHDAYLKLAEWYGVPVVEKKASPSLNGKYDTQPKQRVADDKQKPADSKNGTGEIRQPKSNPPTEQVNKNGQSVDVQSTNVNKPLGFVLKDIQPEHPMIQSRGITVETARKFGAGFFPGKGSMANRVVFPLRENGVLIGYCGRTTLEVTQDNPKWRMPAGFAKNTLYNLDSCEVGKPLYVVEGCWAVLYLAQNGMQAAALLGSEMTERQETALANFPVIVVCLDDDSCGHEKAAKVVERLKAAGHRVMRAYLKG